MDEIYLLLLVKVLDDVVELKDKVRKLNHNLTLWNYLESLSHNEVKVSVRLDQANNLLSPLCLFLFRDNFDWLVVFKHYQVQILQVIQDEIDFIHVQFFETNKLICKQVY